MYDTDVFSIIKNLKPSVLVELEITDGNNYLRRGDLTTMSWRESGATPATFASPLKASTLVRKPAPTILYCDRESRRGLTGGG
jgi:dTDP-glucose pyrophosphorylase